MLSARGLDYITPVAAEGKPRPWESVENREDGEASVHRAGARSAGVPATATGPDRFVRSSLPVTFTHRKNGKLSFQLHALAGWASRGVVRRAQHERLEPIAAIQTGVFEYGHDR